MQAASSVSFWAYRTLPSPPMRAVISSMRSRGNGGALSGRMAMLTAIQFNDYPVIQGVTLIVTTCVLIANFTVDLLVAFLDPRVKAGLQMGGN